MVPGEYVELDKMPQTADGKLDRRRLGGMGEEQEEGGEGGEGWSVEARGGRGGRVVGARSGVEEVVAGIWGEVLGRKEVGVEENFFELGGHSLLATQVMARVRSVL